MRSIFFLFAVVQVHLSTMSSSLQESLNYRVPCFVENLWGFASLPAYRFCPCADVLFRQGLFLAMRMG